MIVLAIGRDKHRTRVARRDRKVIFGLVKPKFFYYEILRIANETNSDFNGNTHKATAFKKASRGMRKAVDIKKGDEIVGGEISIIFPFRCEETVVEWRYRVTPAMTKRS